MARIPLARQVEEAQLARIIAKELNKQRIAVLKEVSKDIPQMDELFWEGHRESMIAAVIPPLVGIYDRAVGVTVKQEPIGDLASRSIRWSRQYAGELVRGITQTTRRAVSAAVATLASTPGMTIRDLRDMLATTFGAPRAQLIAVTETTRAIFEGGAEGAAAMPVQRIGIWTTIMDDRVCPICAPLEGVRETASKSKQWISPDDGQVYRPPAHPNCRCEIVYEFL